VGQAAPTSPIRATAEYDAAAVLIQTDNWPRANSVLEDFRHNFPNHPLSAEVNAKLAVGYVAVGSSALAAAEFQKIANGDGGADVKREALWRSAELYAKSGQTAQAAAAYGQFVQRYPNPVPEAIEARQKLVDIAAASGNVAERTRWQKEIVAADATAGAERSDRTRYLAAKTRS